MWRVCFRCNWFKRICRVSELFEESELFELGVREHDFGNRFKWFVDKKFLTGGTAMHITIPNTTLLDKYDVCSHVATDSSDCWSTRRCTMKWLWKAEQLCLLQFRTLNKCDVCAFVAIDSSDLWSTRRCTMKWFWKEQLCHITIPNTTLLDKNWCVCLHRYRFK